LLGFRSGLGLGGLVQNRCCLPCKAIGSVAGLKRSNWILSMIGHRSLSVYY
jgi:hypothetical protein